MRAWREKRPARFNQPADPHAAAYRPGAGMVAAKGSEG
jgi:hypothetical protein